MTDEVPTKSKSYKSCRNRNLRVNVQQKYRKDVVLAAIFCFAYFKNIKDRMLSDRFELSTPKLCKKKLKKSLLKCRAMFYILAEAKYTHFQKRSQ